MILSYRQLYVITKQLHVTKTEPFLSEMTHANVPAAVKSFQ